MQREKEALEKIHETRLKLINFIYDHPGKAGEDFLNQAEALDKLEDSIISIFEEGYLRD